MAKRRSRRRRAKGATIKRIRVKGRGTRCIRIQPGKRPKFVSCRKSR